MRVAAPHARAQEWRLAGKALLGTYDHIYVLTLPDSPRAAHMRAHPARRGCRDRCEALLFLLLLLLLLLLLAQLLAARDPAAERHRAF